MKWQHTKMPILFASKLRVPAPSEVSPSRIVSPQKAVVRQSLTRVLISKNLEKKWLNNFSLARENGIFSSLSCLDFQDVEKKILFLFSIYEIFQTILFLFSIFKIFKKNSLSFLDLWDSETRFSFSSRIFKILREKNLFLFLFNEIFKTIPFLFSIFRN